MTSPLPENEAVRRLHAQYAVARALAESSSLGEAAPRILQAICEALGWDHGGPVADRRRPGRPAVRGDLAALPAWRFPEFEAASRRLDLRPGSRPARAGVGEPPAGLHPRRHRHDDNFPRAKVASREGLRGALGYAHPARRPGARRAGVLQPRDRAARRGAPRDAGHGREPDRPVRGAQARGGGARDALRDVARHAVHRRRRRHLPPAEPGLGEDARLHRRRADVAALRRVRPPGRPAHATSTEAGALAEGTRLRPLREPLPLQGRLLPLAGLEVDAAPRRGPRLRDGARRHRAEAGRGGAAARAGGGRSRRAGRRATSSPT